jgi:peptidyl-prolyl cis-trans isomerase D
MLRGIRKASSNWLGRIVMGVVMTLLAGSFAVWGINDIFHGFGTSSIAKIGNTEIKIDQFRQTYNDRLRQLEQQLGRPIPPEQANAFGVNRQVLSEMVAEAGLNERAHQMRLGISDAEVARLVTSNPSFLGPDGKFDRARFEDTLRNNGMTEQRFVTEQRGLTLRRQITDSISGNLAVPKAWLDAINRYQNEQRSIAYIALGSAQAGDIPQPTDDQISKYFDERRITFRAPEYRKIVTVAATPTQLAKTLEVSDDDVKKIYDQNRSRFVTPEKRHVEQMVFPTMAEAQAASERIKSGTSFAALATERGLKEPDLDLGTVTKSTIIDPAVADAAFSLKEGDVSEPLQGRFGAVIVTVAKIIPEDTKSFADVAPQIRSDLALQRVKQNVQDIHDKIEDARAGGSTLEEAAQKLQLAAVTFDALDRSGRDPSGKFADVPHSAEVLNAAFATDVGVDNDPIEADSGYIWYDVTGITPAHDRALDEVKSEVETHWRDDQIASRLKDKAADILDKLKSGSTLETLAAANGVAVQTATGIKRGQTVPAFSARPIETMFHTAKDDFGSAVGDRPSDWIVFRVTDDSTPDFDANTADTKRLDQTMQRQVSEDIFAQYMAWLEDQLGTTINQAALAQALGNGTPDTN